MLKNKMKQCLFEKKNNRIQKSLQFNIYDVQDTVLKLQHMKRVKGIRSRVLEWEL